MNALPVYDDRYINSTIRTYKDKVYVNFHGFNGPQDGNEYKFFPIVSIDYLLVNGNKHYLQVYLDNCAYKIINK